MSLITGFFNVNYWDTDAFRSNVSAKDKAELLMALVDKVKELEYVVVKSSTFINDDDELVVIPGPWAIVKPVQSPETSGEEEDDEDEDEDDSPSNIGRLSPFSRRRSASTTSTTAPSRNSRSSPTSSHRQVSATVPKYVIRNEFGHARIQQYIVHPERLGVHYHTLLQSDSSNGPSNNPPNARERGSSLTVIPEEELFETGGHVVLSEEVFEECISKGWGMKHPLAGHYHPITGSEIPPTTMLFRAPRSTEELNVVWGIVLQSYFYITQATNRDVSKALSRLNGDVKE